LRVIGLTGGIAMGKSTVAALFRRAQVPVFDADAAVHRLQAAGGDAVAPIASLVPGALVGGGIDRARLRRAVLEDRSLLPVLERIIHPLVGRERAGFLARARSAGAPFVVLDVPLLFETGGDRDCDLVVAVTAPRALQRQRIVARRTMSAAEADRIIARQMDDRARRARADIVVCTGLSRHHAARQVLRLLDQLRSEAPISRRRTRRRDIH
jgi:dephospho-CoA kinase